MSVWNGHYACACYHPLFVFSQFGDLERCALRPGNVHSADGWDGVLKPVVARYQRKLSRIYMRADAAFAMPEVVNALRAHLAEFGVIAPQGLRNVGRLIAIIRDDDDARLPGLARQVLQVLAVQIEQLEAAIAALEKQLMGWHKSNPVSQRLATIPGIGPIIATAIAAMVAEPSGFRSGREFAAWLGLVPRQNSTGGKNRLGGISKRGNQYLRRLLINGASANLLRSKATNADPWVIGLRRRRPSLVVAVALANKTARIAWAVMHRQENYQRMATAA